MLKSLEVFGFKSFADRTRFDFAPGITGIVGPNGSGKSNVVDAIKWILGDQSPKSLRGKEMADVIFNGAAGRKPSGLAEATLTFDNSSGWLPSERQEIQIGRRLYRGGDAEYLINGEPARLKDIRELFLGTGAGNAAYCIIEQGRVDQILQASAVNRRAIFEEAAGISRYKHRKTEALKKLERVDQNLLRLTDIVEEVEAQRNALRHQAEKAAKYREVSQELKELWLGLAADDYRHHSADLEQLEQTIQRLGAQIEEKNSRLTELERTLAEVDAEAADIENRLRDVDRDRAGIREAMARHESTVRHETARLRELDADLVRLRKQRRMMASRIREVVAEIGYVKGQLERCEADFSQQTRALTVRDIEIRELTGEIDSGRQAVEENRHKVLEQMRAVSSAGQRVSGIESQREAAGKARESAEARRGELEQQIASCEENCRRCQDAVQSAQGDLVQAEQRAQVLSEQRESILAEQEDYQKILARLREQRSAWQARKSVLEDLEDRQHGLGIGVKEILRRAKTSDYPPWSHVLGSVADLLHVELEQAALFEVALGPRAQLIVLQQLDSMLHYLQSGPSQIAGRVGFLVYAGGEGGGQSPPVATGGTHGPPPVGFDSGPHADLSHHNGVRQRADRVIQSPEHLPRLAEQLLADTWIVETVETALELSAGPGRGCRFVTLQGEVLDPDGTLTVGTVHNDQALISRKSELRRLKNDLGRLERDLAEEEHRLATLDDSLLQANDELHRAERDLQQQSDRHAERKSDLAAQTQKLQRLTGERAALDAEVERLTAQDRELAEDLRRAQMELAQMEEDLQSLQAEIEQRERDTARSEHRLQRHQEKRHAEQLELAKQEQRLENMRDAFRRLQEDQQHRVAQRDEVERRFARATSKRRQVVLRLLNTNALLAEHFLTDERHLDQAASVVAEKRDLQFRRSQLLEDEAEVRRRRRELTEAQHREEIAARDIRHQISSLEQRIEEEYQLVLSDVVASGASALRSDCDGESQLGQETPDDQSRIREHIEAQVNRLRRKLKTMGTVSTDSLRDLDELEERYGQLSTQLEDLTEAKAALEEIVQRINAESRRLFTETFEAIRINFQNVFRRAFGGGQGEVLLEDPDDILECGIDIVARPPGKELKSISLLSGGEKTLTAFALLLAIFNTRGSPYCLLDEVDAALDEANVGRMLAMLEEFRETTQFVLITHKKPTMTIADVLYGVTMEESGVSKRMSVRFEDVRENGEFKPGSTQPSAEDGANRAAA